MKGDGYTTPLFPDYNYFKGYYQNVAIDLSKQQALGAGPKGIQQINFTGNLNYNTTMFSIIEEEKETILDFSQGTVKVLWINFTLMQYQYKMTQCNTLNIKLSNLQR